MPVVSSQDFYEWHEDFVIQGNSGEDQEKTGSIVYLAQDRRTEIGRINLHQCGIFKLSQALASNGAMIPGFVTAFLYCERMDFDF